MCPSQPGKCTWEVPWPKVWAESFLGFGGVVPCRPLAAPVFPRFGKNCEAFEPAKKELCHGGLR